MKYILRALGLAFGALIYTIGLDVFLVPNHVIDGGVVGIALMAAQVTGISFSVFIIILNIPFFIFGYKKIGAFFTISSLFSILCLSGWSTFIHYERVTSDPFLSTIYGGIIIGLGAKVSRTIRKHDARMMEVNPTYSTVLLAGLTEDIADLFQQLNSYNCLLQYTRSGRIAVTRSFDEPISDYLKQNSED